MLSPQLSTGYPQIRQCFVIVVHYGNPASTRAALARLLAGTVVPSRIFIIDHAHAPLTDIPEDPRVQVVRPPRNAGYGAGLNMGLGMLWASDAQAADVVICMNADVEVYADTIEKALQWWQANPTPALVGVVTEEADSVRSGVGYVQWWSGRAQLFPFSFPEQPSSYRGLPYIHGAFVMAPYEVYLRLGGWPEHYFLYWEDALLGRRARTKGIPLTLASTVRVRHQTDEHASSAKLYYLVRNGALFMEREAPLWLRVPWRLGNRLRLGWHQLHGGARHRLIAQALRDARQRVTGPTRHVFS